jgi:dihydroxyacetone kinase-like predicted kinase
VEIVPTTNVPQGLAALVAFNVNLSLQDNIVRMTARSKEVKAAAVTRAVRDSVVNGHTVAAGKYIGVQDNKVIVDADDVGAALRSMVEFLLDDEDEVASLYYGASLTKGEAQVLADDLAVHLPAVQIELYLGGQPHYDFIISIE